MVSHGFAGEQGPIARIARLQRRISGIEKTGVTGGMEQYGRSDEIADEQSLELKHRVGCIILLTCGFSSQNNWLGIGRASLISPSGASVDYYLVNAKLSSCLLNPICPPSRPRPRQHALFPSKCVCVSPVRRLVLGHRSSARSALLCSAWALEDSTLRGIAGCRDDHKGIIQGYRDGEPWPGQQEQGRMQHSWRGPEGDQDTGEGTSAARSCSSLDAGTLGVDARCWVLDTYSSMLNARRLTASVHLSYRQCPCPGVVVDSASRSDRFGESTNEQRVPISQSQGQDPARNQEGDWFRGVWFSGDFPLLCWVVPLIPVPCSNPSPRFVSVRQ